MKKSLKFLTSMLAMVLLFTACSTTTGTTVGTVNGKNLVIPYFDEIFKPEEESTDNNEEDSNTLDAGTTTDADEVEYDETSALLVHLVGELFKTTGNNKVDKQKLNLVINNLKGTHGDKYLEEASKQYKLPIKTEEDLVQILTFSVLYSSYLEKIANITNEEISEEYLKTYAVQYCADNIVVKDEADAIKLTNMLQSGEKTFEDFMADAKAAQDATGSTQQTQQTQTTVSANDALIAGVQVSQISDLGCKPSSGYVAEFADALESMTDGTYTETPVKSQFGYHIINLRETKKQDLDKALQKKIKDSLVSKKQQEAGFSSYHLLQLFDESDITITNERFQKTYDTYYEELKKSAESYKPAAEDNDEETTTEATE